MGGLDMARHAWQPVHDHDQDQDKEHDKEQDKPQDKLAHRRRAVLVVSLLVVVFLAASLVAALATTTSLSCLWAGDCSTSHSRNMTEVLGEPCDITSNCGDAQVCCCEHKPAKAQGYCLWTARCEMEMKSKCRA